ncbi:MAG: HAD-IB family phosphatase [Bacteroidota bacterium]
MKTLHLFDFDGTLSNTDSAKYFYKRISNPFLYFSCYYFLPIIQIMKYFLLRGSNFDIKKKRLALFIKYSSTQKVESYLTNSIDFIHSILIISAKNELQNLKKNPENHIFIVSASLSILLEKWAEQEGIGLITNKVDISLSAKTVKFHNQFDCDGIGKVLLIKKEIDLQKYDKIIAYGDSPNDFPMLSLADQFYYKFFV